MPRMSCPPTAEIQGASLLSYLDNLKSEEIAPLLEKYGIDHIDPNEWYLLKPFMNVIDDLSSRRNFDENMVAIGLKVADHAITPELKQFMTLASAMEGWNEQFKAIHRNGDVGEIVAEKVADRHYRLIHRHVYPVAMNYGIMYGFAKHLLPQGAHFSVQYEDIFKRLDYGGAEETVIIIKWE